MLVLTSTDGFIPQQFIFDSQEDLDIFLSVATGSYEQSEVTE